jgi:hypothetical protein
MHVAVVKLEFVSHRYKTRKLVIRRWIVSCSYNATSPISFVVESVAHNDLTVYQVILVLTLEVKLEQSGYVFIHTEDYFSAGVSSK